MPNIQMAIKSLKNLFSPKSGEVESCSQHFKCYCSRCSNKDKDLIQLKDFISSSSCSTYSTTSSYLWLVWLALGLAALAACVFALFKYKSNRLILCFSLMQDHDEYLFTGLVFWKGKSLSGRLAGTKLSAQKMNYHIVAALENKRK